MSARRLESKRFPRLDRLSTLSALWLGISLAACSESSAAPAPGRVVAVSQAKKTANEAEFCDVLKGDAAPSFVYPELRGDAPKARSGYQWINVWATWCPPCVEELPLLGRFRDQLVKEGSAVTLSLLSVDETPEVVGKFAKAHPEVQGSLQIKDAAALEAWLPKIGLDTGATLPIHLFVDGGGKVRCARTGALRESDLPALKKLISGS